MESRSERIDVRQLIKSIDPRLRGHLLSSQDRERGSPDRGSHKIEKLIMEKNFYISKLPKSASIKRKG